MTSPQMAQTWIVDTSPFVGLAKVGRLDVLTAPNREVLITEVVEREVISGSRYDLAQQALTQGWGLRVSTPGIPPALAAFSLDVGEASVLTVALGRAGSVAILDDRAGRIAAKALGIPTVGTVGVLLRARQEGRLVRMAPVIRDLQAAGLYLPKEGVLKALLESVDEAWP